MNESERKAMMKSMMEQFFGGMNADEKMKMCATMMGKMTEGIDMSEMMPKMMMGMMSGSVQGRAEHKMPHMPEMMLKQMMPHGIGIMLPAIDPDRRGDVAAAILTAIVEKGLAGMSDEQRLNFLNTLNHVLNASTPSGSEA